MGDDLPSAGRPIQSFSQAMRAGSIAPPSRARDPVLESVETGPSGMQELQRFVQSQTEAMDRDLVGRRLDGVERRMPRLFAARARPHPMQVRDCDLSHGRH